MILRYQILLWNKFFISSLIQEQPLNNKQKIKKKVGSNNVNVLIL